MTVAFDGWNAATDAGEKGALSRMVIKAVAGSFPDVQVDIYVPRRKDYPLLGGLPRMKNVRICYPEHSLLKFCPSAWRRYGLPAELRRRRPDVYHGLDGRLPSGIGTVHGLACVATLHDLSFLSDRSCTSWIQLHSRNAMCRHASLSAHRLVVFSQEVATDLVKYYFIPKERISVVRDLESPDVAEQIMASYRDAVREAL